MLPPYLVLKESSKDETYRYQPDRGIVCGCGSFAWYGSRPRCLVPGSAGPGQQRWVVNFDLDGLDGHDRLDEGEKAPSCPAHDPPSQEEQVKRKSKDSKKKKKE
jgi:hypothetical protein